MKKTLPLLICLILFFIISCDKVKRPIQTVAPTPVVDTNKYIRKVLLEDYTGHTCGNCPPAAAQAEALSEQNGGKVVVIAVHAGDFAATKTQYPTSYTTTTGNDWDGSAGFNISRGAGNPNGLINRKSYDGSNIIQALTKWSSSVSSALTEPYILGLTIKPVYDAANRKLNVTVKAGFKTSYVGNTKLTLVLIEDSIIGPQTDYSLNPNKVPNYVFMHMLRGSVNGSWGTTLKNTPIAAKDSVSLSFNDFAINPLFKDKNLYLVAFASNESTREVLQVQKVKLKQ